MGNGPSTCCRSEISSAGQGKACIDLRFGEGCADAFQGIIELLGRVEMKMAGPSMRRMSYPFMVNIGMVLAQATQERRYARPPTSGTPFADVRVLKKAARYVQYAAAAYHTNKASVAECIPGLCANDVKHMQVGPGPGFFISVDPESDDIVLCIRGPYSAAEAISGAISTKEPLLGGMAHGGILQSARGLVDAALPLLMRLTSESPRKGIAIVGYSVAAGVGTLATVLMASEGCPLAKLMSTGRVKCYAFAPPPVFEPLWALPAWVHGSTYSFIYNMDCVPRTCMGTVAKLYCALREIDQQSVGVEDRIAFIRGEVDIVPHLPDAVDVPPEFSFAMSSLHVIGSVIVLFQQEDGKLCCEHAVPHLTDRILLSPQLMSNHALKNYEQAFEDLRAQSGVSDACVVS